MGILSLSLFGSTARGEERAESDVDLAVRFDPARGIGLFQYNAIANRIQDLLGEPVDLVSEPARKAWMQDAIDRDRCSVF